MGLLSLAIWTPIAFGTVLLALGRDEHARAVMRERHWQGEYHPNLVKYAKEKENR